MAALLGTLAFLWQRAPREGDPIGLFTTLPILWNETGDVAALLAQDQAPHWARAALSARGRLIGLDTLQDSGRVGSLAGLKRLLIAQPRPLGPAENIALDRWVRAGGRLLLVADPALTAESSFALGDPRRPQAVVLLSPILTRWGLTLQFDDHQPFADRLIAADEGIIPVNLAGSWAIASTARCQLSAEGLVADCAIGKGRVLAVADAAVLDRDDPDGQRQAALARLLDRAFPSH